MKFLIGLPTIFLLLACDSGNKCVADCDEAGANEGSGSSDDTAGSQTGGESAACEAANVAADAFLENNKSCESSLECRVLGALCYQGPQQLCGSVAYNRNAAPQPWSDAYSTLEGCESMCGADPCGFSGPFCNEAGECEITLDSERVCDALNDEYAAFLAENRACETVADCVQVQATCYQGPERVCFDVGLNVDADLEFEQQLDYLLMTFCEMQCVDAPCGTSLHCIDNECVSMLP